jgi:hypothetical protein
VTTPQAADWHKVDMHYGLLYGQSHIWEETGGYLPLEVSSNAYAGSKTITLDNTTGLLENQLISYRGSDNQYYTAQIQAINNDQITLNAELASNVWAGESAWNFYDDPSHANYRGSQAIADYAIRRIGYGNLNFGKHVLFGDSWFSHGTIRDRLDERLSSAQIINLGIGGRTSTNLLDAFDSEVAEHAPDFVWIITGTNDYWQSISAATYKQNMQALINKIQALGAMPIIIDSSVAPKHYGSDHLTLLSHDYVAALQAIWNGN